MSSIAYTVSILQADDMSIRHGKSTIYMSLIAHTVSKVLCICFDRAQKQRETISPFADVCILYEILPKRLTLNGKIGSRSFLPGPFKRKALYFASRCHVDQT